MDNNQNNGYNYYRNNSYDYNNFNSPYMKNRQNPLSVAAMILGILSSICCCLGYAGIIFGIAAIVIACFSKKENGRFDPMALVGLVLGIFGLVLSASMLAMILLAPEDVLDEYFNSYFEQFGQGMDEIPDF